ncbi:hypothetical protein PSN45_003713 [Yamadazyma tenuis]|uniref:uncharacterized protein n=1 Tax=Candida tenuis TaxID=2315449 RepID=UPI00279AEF54|nr:hypothetical protein PSN45_003713 [Yamadazyma tenuis]
MRSFGKVRGKMLKEPLRIGYPLQADNTEILTALRSILFEENPKQHDIREISHLFSIDEGILTGQHIPISSLYSKPPPEKLAGKLLFRSQYSSIQEKLLYRWNSVEPSIQSQFSDEHYVNNAFETRTRIWQGYEIVEFLKRFSTHRFNPYYYSGLKPWEIIMDKFSSQQKQHQDYYDVIIKSAFKHQKLSPAQIHGLEEKLDDFSHVPELSLQHTSESRMAHLQEKWAARQVHNFYLETKPHPIGHSYSRFVSQLKSKSHVDNFTDLSKRASQLWSQMSKTEKMQYKVVDNSTLLHRFIRTHWKLVVALDYIYDVNLSDFDWRSELPVDKFYFNGSYLNYYLYLQGNRLYVLEPNQLFTDPEV